MSVKEFFEIFVVSILGGICGAIVMRVLSMFIGYPPSKDIARRESKRD